MDQTKLYQKQISLTEWFASVDHVKTEVMRKEDNEKRERLKVLRGIIGIPFDEPHQFPAMEIAQPSERFRKFLAEHGHELCALRLIPHDPNRSKLRMRGHTVKDVLQWFNEQKIDPTQYKADFVPHAEKSEWSTIFIVNQNGIFGEIIRGGHYQLTQGFHAEGKPIMFAYDFTAWKLSEQNEPALNHLKEIMQQIRVDNSDKRRMLQEQLQATFAHDYLCAYWETVYTKEFGLWFVDYNRILGEMYAEFTWQLTEAAEEALLRGQVGCPGTAIGSVRIIRQEDIGKQTVSKENILVCEMTTPEYVPLMREAAAIVTDWGGVLTHAAIVARELQKPCIIGTKHATTLLKDGDMIEVDANKGVIRKVKAA